MWLYVVTISKKKLNAVSRTRHVLYTPVLISVKVSRKFDQTSSIPFTYEAILKVNGHDEKFPQKGKANENLLDHSLWYARRVTPLTNMLYTRYEYVCLLY